jgi:RNA polymerase sigma-70 factor (ECF subfamily)
MTPGQPPPDLAAETLSLLTAARDGDADALDRLFAKYLPGLRHWASGRLPAWARDLGDTHDLVQETVIQVFRKLDGFEYRGEGALKAYLRRALMNRLRNEIRRARARPAAVELDTNIEDRAPSPVSLAIDAQKLARYEAALSQLRPEERELVIARLELGMTYQEIATRLGKPSMDAARMGVVRALVRLSEEMK